MRRKLTMKRLSASLLALALCTAPAMALTMQRASLQRLTKSNDTILTGKVVEAYSYWNSDGTWIITDFKISPAEVIKGAVEEPELTLTMLGGKVGETTVLIPGSPALEIGKSYVLFVQATDLPGAAKAKTLSGYSQSVFDIVPTKDGPRAVSQAGGMSLMPDADGKSRVPGGAAGLSLDELKQSIRAILAETVSN